jgi:ankyrin repeat protein
MRRNVFACMMLLVVFVCSCANQAQLKSQLEAAVLRGDVNKVKLLIDQGVDIKQANNNQSLIEMAIIHSHSNVPQMLSLLLAHGIDINEKDKEGYPPIIKAFIFNKFKPDVLDVLLEYGADINQQDSEGRTVLCHAVTYPVPDTELIQLLLKKGANPNIKNSKGETALHLAVFNIRPHQAEIIKILLQNGADVNIKDNSGQIAINKISGHNEEIWIALIEAGSDLTVLDEMNETPLLSALRWDAIEAAKLMIKKGADVNAKDKWGTSVFRKASYSGNTELIKMIVDKGGK